MCDGLRDEKAEFAKALDTYISAKIHNGIKNYHYRKGEYDWLSDRCHTVKCDGCGKWVQTTIPE